MEIIWHGTASIELRTKEGKILFDPFVPLHGSKVDVKLEDFDGFNDIFITHGHLDHIVSLPSIYERNPGIRIWCTEAPYKTLKRKKIPKENLEKIQFGEEICVHGFKLRVLHGKHAVLPKPTPKLLKSFLASPARENLHYLLHENTLCKERGETVFYEIEAEGKRFSLLGSLNLRDDIEYPTDCDYLILPYNGWVNNFPPAVRVVERLCPKNIFLDHFDDTFPPFTGEVDLAPILEKYAGKIQPLEHNKTIMI
ncbi:MAG: MBL fold metallo-hydrolase [Clostridia bacterium]|nr:MBL fold metallo-hydrolase [Clostridia bacterium]